MIKAYIDAATKGNPGPSAGGIVLVGENLYLQKSIPLPIQTNHQAEFATFVALLDDLTDQQKTNEMIVAYTDSKILAETIKKNYTKNPDFQNYLLEIQKKLQLFPNLYLRWIPESQNKGADNLAKQGLKKQLQKRS